MDLKTTSQRLAESMEQTWRHWVTHRKADMAVGTSPTPLPTRFTIALTRESGADGPLVARAIGKRLGWPVYDRELLERVAEEMGLRADLLESVDEKRKSWLLECLESLTSAPAVSESGFVRHLLETILSLAAHGECVILGRGAAQILPASTTLRVRLVGPVKKRIEAFRQKFGISSEEAARRIEKADYERGRFIKDHFHMDPTEPQRYDLVINFSRFSVAQCADIIIEALQRLQAHVPAQTP